MPSDQINATLKPRVICDPQALSKLRRFLRPQRPEIKRRYSGARTPAPSLIERVAFNARGHCKDERARARGIGNGCEIVERIRFRPMQILHDQEHRPARAHATQKRGGNPAFATVTRRVVHGIVERALLRWLRQVEKVIEEDQVIRCCGSAGDRIRCRGAALGFRRSRRHAEHACNECTKRIAPLARSKIENERDVTGKSARSRFLGEHLRQAGLADAGFAADVDDCAVPGLRNAVEHRLQHGDLATAAHQRHGGGRCWPGARADHAPYARRCVEPFEGNLPHGFELDQLLHRLLD